MKVAQNPFPGMNPYLEEHWPGVHARLTTYIADQLQERLPPGLVARPEEHVTIEEDGLQVTMRPDVRVSEPTEPPALREPVHAFAAMPHAEGGVSSQPLIVLVEPEKQRRVKIVDAEGRLVTVLEVLSPTNKSEEGQSGYRRRQRTYISGGVNLVEIDLLRKGEWVVSVPLAAVPESARGPYRVCVFRASQPLQREIYLSPLRERLPTIRVPLRAKDPDAPLDLQSAVDQVFERGRYEMLDYARPLAAPLAPGDEAWADELLRKAGLRS